MPQLTLAAHRSAAEIWNNLVGTYATINVCRTHCPAKLQSLRRFL